MKHVVASLCLVLIAGSAWAEGDPEAGRTKSGTCVACHGAEGISPNPDMWPTLAGQDAAYLLEQLHAFQSGERDNPMMKPMVQGLSEQDLMDLAAYFSSLPGE